jgi:hypothetical protein
MSELDLEVADTGVRSELPLEVLLNSGGRAEDIGEGSVAGAVCRGPGVGTGGAGVGVRIDEDDCSLHISIRT